MRKDKLTILQFLGILSLAAGFLWQPAGAASQPAPAEQRRAAGRFSARLVGDAVIIDGHDFPAEHAYYVKARRTARSGWMRLGAAFSTRRGDLHVRLSLQKELRKTPVARVCLKDLLTDQVFCVDALRIARRPR